MTLFCQLAHKCVSSGSGKAAFFQVETLGIQIRWPSFCDEILTHAGLKHAKGVFDLLVAKKTVPLAGTKLGAGSPLHGIREVPRHCSPCRMAIELLGRGYLDLYLAEYAVTVSQSSRLSRDVFGSVPFRLRRSRPIPATPSRVHGGCFSCRRGGMLMADK